MPLLIFIAAICSGAAALIFETLWFEQLGLVLGNTVQSSTLVLAAFMAGLGGGYRLASRWLNSIRHPARAYITVEAVAALSSLAIFALLSHSSTLLIPAIGLASNACSSCVLLAKPLIALAILGLPAVLFGMTLPLLVAVLSNKYSVSVLYSANTLGACLGAVALPLLMDDHIGWTEIATFALGLQLAAIVLVAAAWNTTHSSHVTRPDSTNKSKPFPVMPILAAATSGFVILAAEVIWFRALRLEFSGTHDAFSVMLAVVLIGISIGGIANAVLMRWNALSPSRTLGALAIALLAGYIGWWNYSPPDFSLSALTVSSLWLMLPACIVSGLLFPQLVGSLDANAAPATGRLGGYNSWGSAIGAMLAGMVILPLLGIEISLMLIATCTLAVAVFWLLITRQFFAAVATSMIAVTLMVLAQGIASDKMEAAAQWFAKQDQARVVMHTEGRDGTLQLLQNQIGDAPWHSRILSNSYSMSGTTPDSQRYMRLFAHLPLALQDSPKSALLISYGIGNTAQALVSSRSLDQIHIADPSADMLDMSHIIYGEGNPLLDPRIKVHLDDGRHYLATSNRSFDLITGEPPPPSIAGIKSLYSQEYFQLMRQRLTASGLASYWLPIDQLDLSSAKAVLAAFCNAMEECSLWAGSNYNWILIGGPGMNMFATNAAAERQWSHPPSALSLKISGVETPEQLAATFIADKHQIALWINNADALIDAYPRRLHPQKADSVELRLYSHWMDDIETETRFRQSSWVQNHASPLWQATAAKWFALQPILNNQIRLKTDTRVALVADMLNNSELEMPIYWLLGSDYKAQKISARYINKPNTPPDVIYHLATRALAERKFSVAGNLFELQQSLGTHVTPELAILSYCYAGDIEKAKAVKDRAFGSRESINRCWE